LVSDDHVSRVSLCAGKLDATRIVTLIRNPVFVFAQSRLTFARGIAIETAWALVAELVDALLSGSSG
jgi:hypothetical protein